MDLIGEEIYFEADERVDDRRWRRIETYPYSGHYSFASETAAEEAAQRICGSYDHTYRIRRVVITNQLVREVSSAS